MLSRLTLLVSVALHLLVVALFFLVPFTPPKPPLQPVFAVALVEMPPKKQPTAPKSLTPPAIPKEVTPPTPPPPKETPPPPLPP
ncbi:MAG: cell envelope integrity protein TolA, partial [Magnetococcales bacterium]|nr:cell envelope integrity protein TolA [Magnetococcales bacterium]